MEYVVAAIILVVMGYLVILPYYHAHLRRKELKARRAHEARLPRED